MTNDDFDVYIKEIVDLAVAKDNLENPHDEEGNQDEYEPSTWLCSCDSYSDSDDDLESSDSDE